MSHKKAIKEPLDTEQAKDLELDEEPKPTRKVGKPSVPASETLSQVPTIRLREDE